MIYSRQPGNLDNAVLQIPYIFSCQQGNDENFECPDALVVHDFKSCIDELQKKGVAGIAFLIDEADCLGKNVPLLQMFRNIFQTVECCSLILAGTEAVFPALSEVFSPIPRQFHRIDCKPFAHWFDTLSLVLRPLKADIRQTIAPDIRVLQQLHDLCGGAPDEVQLYCHHMYRSIENNQVERMALIPQVFREVLKEYRASSPSNMDVVLNAIERLPDKLLFKSKWLSRRALTLDENIRVALLRRELKTGTMLSEDERAAVITKIQKGYCDLFELGISESSDRIQLAGSPLSAGFWKSFVEVERSKRWTWNDNSFSDHLRLSIMKEIGFYCDASVALEKMANQEIENAITSLRAGIKIPDIQNGFEELVISCLIAKEKMVAHVTDCLFEIESPAGKKTFQYRYFEKSEKQIDKQRIQDWLLNNTTLLANHGIKLSCQDCRRWQLPSSIELHRLGRISGNYIPEEIGPSEFDQAFSMFEDGDIGGCIELFSKMLVDRDEPTIRNNLAFCQILSGAVADGLENVTKAILDKYAPLFEMNKGIAELIQGNRDAAKLSLTNALKQLNDPNTEFKPNASYVLIFDKALNKVISYDGLPVAAAILINLWQMGEFTDHELESELTKIDVEKVRVWLEKIKKQTA